MAATPTPMARIRLMPSNPLNAIDMHRSGLLHRLLMMLALCWCATACAGSPMAGTVSASNITGITLEHNCFGCANGSVLVLSRDGTATLTTPGNARSGTEDKTTKGSIRPEEFDKLARFAESKGFFQLRDIYEDPQVKDGPSTTIRIARGTQEKQVFRRDEAGPESLKALETAIDAAKSQIRFAP